MIDVPIWVVVVYVALSGLLFGAGVAWCRACLVISRNQVELERYRIGFAVRGLDVIEDE